jgi:hypothetical protein
VPLCGRLEANNVKKCAETLRGGFAPYRCDRWDQDAKRPLKSGLKDGRIDLAAFARRTELIGPGDLSSPRRRARSRKHLSDPTPHSRGLSIPVGSRVFKASIVRPGIFSGR